MNTLIIDRSECKGLSTQGTKVYLNGEELHGVTSTTMSIDVNNVPTFNIELIGNVEIINRQ